MFAASSSLSAREALCLSSVPDRQGIESERHVRAGLLLERVTESPSRGLAEKEVVVAERIRAVARIRDSMQVLANAPLR